MDSAEVNAAVDGAFNRGARRRHGKKKKGMSLVMQRRLRAWAARKAKMSETPKVSTKTRVTKNGLQAGDDDESPARQAEESHVFLP